MKRSLSPSPHEHSELRSSLEKKREKMPLRSKVALPTPLIVGMKDISFYPPPPSHTQTLVIGYINMFTEAFP